jgi:trehalose-phosphatase
LNLGIGSKRLWVFDFDGSVSRQATDSNDVRLHARCEAMLRFLARGPWNRVAVISTRRLDDLAARIPLPKVLLRGASGLEWESAGGYRSCPGKGVEKILGVRRRTIVPLLRELESIPWVEVEDKNWSVAIRYRDTSPRHFLRRVHLLQRLRNRVGIKVYRGHEGAEVQMVPGGSKSAGVRRLCRLIGWDPSSGEIIYAGGDETDATAMKWVLLKGGTVYVVGNGITVPNARYVKDPTELISEVHAYSGAATKDNPLGMGIEASG